MLMPSAHYSDNDRQYALAGVYLPAVGVAVLLAAPHVGGEITESYLNAASRKDLQDTASHVRHADVQLCF